MIDKKHPEKPNEINDLDGAADEFEFDDDLDLDKDLGLEDDMDLDDDELFLNDDIDSYSASDEYSTEEQRSQYTNPYGRATAQDGGVIETLKSYGFVILLVFVFGYFGLKYSLSSLWQAKDGSDSENPVIVQKNTETDVAIPGDDNKPSIDVPDSIKKALNDPKDPKDTKESKDTKETADTASKSDETSADKTTDKNTDSSKGTDVVNIDDDEIPSSKTSDATKKTTDKVADKSSEEQASSQQDKKDDNGLKTYKKEYEEVMARNKELSNKIDKLEKGVNNVNQQITEQLASGQSNITDIKKQMTAVNKQVDEVTAYVKDASKLLSSMASELKNQAVVLSSLQSYSSSPGLASTTTSSATTVGSRLKVDAIIAGRAWLKTSKGASVSVAVGDNIPGYGTVTEIDVNRSTVRTNSGKVIN